MQNRHKKISVSLVLGSGGARGMAHIGVIRELERNGFEIKSISGCSIGAVIGGIFAAGKLDEFEQWVCAIDKVDIVSLLDISFRKGGLVKGEKIINSLKKLVGEQNIEDLPIPYTAIAADVKNEKEVWINSGCLFDAFRASISLPLFFTPVKHNDTYLIDGGVLNPVPIAPTFNDKTDITIAVNLAGSVDEIAKLKSRPMPRITESENEGSDIHLSIKRFIGRLKTSPQSTVDGWGSYNIATEAFDAMQSTIARAKLAAYPPDITIELARNTCGTFEFDLASQLIELGRIKTRESLIKAGMSVV
ncbi:patatin-like phospholipase family protein [Aliivibrio kagoshimensis]|uniref:patatin-like phospholipase family protein n=1 Tax=Aliivibrio kagoshimensis TaxID=2910230 RepID=UPI003D0B8C2A